jgi:hypothetical protein
MSKAVRALKRTPAGRVTIAVTIRPKDLVRLRQYAARTDNLVTTMCRTWILERLNEAEEDN